MIEIKEIKEIKEMNEKFRDLNNINELAKQKSQKELTKLSRCYSTEVIGLIQQNSINAFTLLECHNYINYLHMQMLNSLSPGLEKVYLDMNNSYQSIYSLFQKNINFWSEICKSRELFSENKCMDVQKFRKACATVHWFAQDSVVELSPGIKKLQQAITDYGNEIIKIQASVNLFEIESKRLQSNYENVDNLKKKIIHCYKKLEDYQLDEENKKNEILNIDYLILDIDNQIHYASKPPKKPKQEIIDNLNNEKKFN